MNENTNVFYFDVSNCVNNLRKLKSGNKIRLAINCWNINVPRNKSLMEITQLVLKITIDKSFMRVQNYLICLLLYRIQQIC